MQIPLLTDIVIISGMALAVLFACNRLRVPAVVGFLVTGVFVVPYGLALVRQIHHIEIFAEVGVVLLLFTIGIEFSFERLLQIRKSVRMGGRLHWSKHLFEKMPLFEGDLK
jgi:CPA2 family monovalent cation:H+ antiporter-2